MPGIKERPPLSHFGRSLKHGTMESFGWNIEGFGAEAKSHGFLGWKKWGTDFQGSAKAGTKLSSLQAVKGAGRIGVRTLGRALPGLTTAYFAYEGYQEGGVFGAAKGIGESVAWSVGTHYAIGALGGTGVLAPVAAVAAVAVGTYMVGEQGRQHAKGLRQMEMGYSDQMRDTITSQGASTMRQRSVAALNNTHLNSRMALGNEAFLLHRSFA
jgi:hypothetical protein